MTYFKGFYSGILEFLSKKMFSDFCIVRIQNLLNSKKIYLHIVVQILYIEI